MVAFFFPMALSGASRSVTQTDSRTSQDSTSNPDVHTFNSCSLGAAHATRGIVILACHTDTSTDPGTTPTCTVGGTSMTRLTAGSTGVGSPGVDSVGTAVFVGAPSGTSANVVINWGTPIMDISIVVLRLQGYDTAGTGLSEHGAGSNGQQAWVITQNDALVYIGGSGSNNSTMSCTGITQRGEGNLGGDNRRVWAFDGNLAANAGLNVAISPWSQSQGANCMSGARFHAL